jgi:hypothetical protein
MSSLLFKFFSRFSQATGIETQWLCDRAERVLSALDNYGCLGFLNNIDGVWQGTFSSHPVWFEEMACQYERRSLFEKEGKKFLTLSNCLDPNCGSMSFSEWWTEGFVSIRTERYELTPEEPILLESKFSRQKLGKWLQSEKASESQLHEFETRSLNDWVYKVSSAPEDVFTMSYRRPWTSCMQPGHAYEDGPLAVAEAGGAMIWWFRPGAIVPCGRQWMLPVVVDGEPKIHVALQVYGSGPEYLDLAAWQDEMEKKVGHKIPTCISIDLQERVRFEGIVGGIYDDNSQASATCASTWEDAGEALTGAFAAFLLKNREPESLKKFRDEAKSLLSSLPSEKEDVGETKEARRGEASYKKAERDFFLAKGKLSQAFNAFLWNLEDEELMFLVLEAVLEVYETQKRRHEAAFLPGAPADGKVYFFPSDEISDGSPLGTLFYSWGQKLLRNGAFTRNINIENWELIESQRACVDLRLRQGSEILNSWIWRVK